MAKQAQKLAVVSVGVGALLLVLFAGPASGAPNPCAAGAETEIYDYQADAVNTSGSLWVEVSGHGDIDIVQLVSCVVGDEIALGVRVSGAVADSDERVSYDFYLRGPGLLGENVYYSNGTAYYTDSSSFDDVAINNTTTGDWLTVYLPLSVYGNATDGWQVEAKSGFDEDGNGFLNFLDWATLDTADEYDADDDFSREPSPFAVPTVAITSVNVTANGTDFKVTVEGTTQGPVVELRVAMASEMLAAGSTTASLVWGGSYWTEGALSQGTINVSVQKVGGSWARWRFERVYSAESLKGIFAGSTLFTVTGAKVEVRAVAADGRWGHANQTFNPTTTTPPPNGGGGGGGGQGAGSSSLLLIGTVVAAAAVAAVAFLLIRRRKKTAAGAAPVQGTQQPPGPPPSPPA